MLLLQVLCLGVNCRYAWQWSLARTAKLDFPIRRFIPFSSETAMAGMSRVCPGLFLEVPASRFVCVLFVYRTVLYPRGAARRPQMLFPLQYCRRLRTRRKPVVLHVYSYVYTRTARRTRRQYSYSYSTGILRVPWSHPAAHGVSDKARDDVVYLSYDFVCFPSIYRDFFVLVRKFLLHISYRHDCTKGLQGGTVGCIFWHVLYRRVVWPT